MRSTTATLTLALLATGACGGGGPLLETDDGKIRVVFRADADWKQERARAEMQAAMARFQRIDLVYAHNDPMAYGARLAAEQAGRAGAIKFIGIDALPGEGIRYVREGKLDATLAYPTCGAEAVDLAILAAAKVALPKDIVVGTRLYTRDNVAAGGKPIGSKADEQLAALREQHAALLQPSSDASKISIGMSQCTVAEPWRVQMNADIEARAAHYPQVELTIKVANDDTGRQRDQIAELVAQGVDAILVSPKEQNAVVTAIDKAIAQGIQVIVLDRRLGGSNYTCFIGGDNEAIGAAAGWYAGELLGGEGVIVEIEGNRTSSPAAERHSGFVEALELRVRRAN